MTSLKQHRDVQNEPAIVVYHGVTVDEAAVIPIGHRDELTLDVHRNRANPLGPSGRQIAGAIVFLLQPRRQRTIVRTIVITNHHDVAAAIVAITAVISIVSIVALVPVISTVVALVATAALMSLLVSGFRAIDKYSSAKQCTGDYH